MNVSTTPPAAIAMSILNTRSFRLQMLAKLVGMRIDHLGKGLGAEQKPTAKVLLSEMEQTLLSAVAENISCIQANAAVREAALRDALDASAYRTDALELQLCKAECATEHAQWELERAQQRIQALETRSFWQRLRG